MENWLEDCKIIALENLKEKISDVAEPKSKKNFSHCKSTDLRTSTGNLQYHSDIFIRYLLTIMSELGVYDRRMYKKGHSFQNANRYSTHSAY